MKLHLKDTCKLSKMIDSFVHNFVINDKAVQLHFSVIFHIVFQISDIPCTENFRQP